MAVWWRILVVILLLVLLVSGLYNANVLTVTRSGCRSLPKRGRIIAQGAWFLVLTRAGSPIVTLSSNPPSDRAVTQIVTFIIVLLSLHFHDYVVATRRNSTLFGVSRPFTSCALLGVVGLVRHVYALGIVVIVMARRPWMISSTCSRRIGVSRCSSSCGCRSTCCSYGRCICLGARGIVVHALVDGV